LRRALVVAEQPTYVCVREPAQRPSPALAVIHVRAVRIARAVREGVVLAVIGDPRAHRPRDRRRSTGREHAAQERARLEAAMREVAVKADRHPEPDRDVGDYEDHNVIPVKASIPCL
jgi:hypothetical protein